MITDSSSSAALGAPSRIPALDVLRGVAVLGILVMNIQSFSMVDAAYLNPAAYGNLDGGEPLGVVLKSCVGRSEIHDPVLSAGLARACG